MATEEPAFSVIAKTNTYEIRRYAPMLVAETEVESDFAHASNKGFRILADYIFGNNVSRITLPMTAPVNQTRAEKIAMTAPVGLQKSQHGFLIQFTMPAHFTLETLPLPNDARVQIRQLPSKVVAVHRYTGLWTQRKYCRELAQFISALRQDGIKTTGAPTFARFNAPYWPWFLRRNEIWLELATESKLPNEHK